VIRGAILQGIREIYFADLADEIATELCAKLGRTRCAVELADVDG
jgi:hypothetical protein